MLTFTATPEDHALILQIVDRFRDLGTEARKHDKLETMMDLTACHASGCPLDLQALLTTDTFTLVHDVCGIRRHLDRTTGQLKDCYRPRTAKQTTNKEDK